MSTKKDVFEVAKEGDKDKGMEIVACALYQAANTNNNHSDVAGLPPIQVDTLNKMRQ